MINLTSSPEILFTFCHLFYKAHGLTDTKIVLLCLSGTSAGMLAAPIAESLFDLKEEHIVGIASVYEVVSWPVSLLKTIARSNLAPTV